MQKPDLTSLPMVRVEWVDSTRFAQRWLLWEELDPAPLVCATVAHLLADTPEYVAVIGSVAEDAAVDGMSIPRVAIRRMVYLEEKPEA